jgi:hypothetical protein
LKLRLFGSAAVVAAACAAAPGIAVPARSDWSGGCAAKTVPFSVSGNGQVLVGPNQPLTGHRLEVLHGSYQADGVTVTLRMQQTTFVISPGSYFRPECFGAYGRGPYPSVKLYLGTIHVSGVPDGPQQTGVRTWEAIAHTLSPGRFEYTVSRDAKSPADGNAGRGHVTVKVARGGPIMLSPRVGIKHEWPCTTGQAFTVDWLGRVTKK